MNTLEGKEGNFSRQKSHENLGVPMGTSKKIYKKSNENFPMHPETFTIILFITFSSKKWGQCHGQRGGQC